MKPTGRQISGGYRLRQESKTEKTGLTPRSRPDGYCAYGVALGQLFDVDPRTGQVIDGKLYVNLNRKILAEFNQDAKGYIEAADQNWPDVLHKAAA